MAYSRSSRRADAKLEAGAKLTLLAIVVLAFLAGGLSHFADALKGILFLVVAAAVLGGAALVISRSHLVGSKKLGLLLILGAVAMALLWAALRAPRRWTEDRATVTAVQSGSATLRLGTTVFAATTQVAVPPAAHWQVGRSVPIWIDPVSRSRFSLEPRTTEGGQRYGMLCVAIALGVAALWLLAQGGRWFDRSASVPPPAIAVSPSSSTASRLRLIDWFQFEGVCARILESEGWTVERRGGANADGGADHMAFKDGRTMVVQCKHWSNWLVKPATIRELNGTRFAVGFKADDAVLFTLSGCTDEALRTAEAEGIAVRSAGELAATIDALGIERFPELLNPDNKTCPKCGAAMVLRSTAKPFWGCSKYPRCRGTIECARG